VFGEGRGPPEKEWGGEEGMGKRGRGEKWEREEGREGSVPLQFLPVPPHFLIPGVAPEETRLE